MRPSRTNATLPPSGEIAGSVSISAVRVEAVARAVCGRHEVQVAAVGDDDPFDGRRRGARAERDDQRGADHGEPASQSPSSCRHSSVCSPAAGSAPSGSAPPNDSAASASVATGPTQTSSPSKRSSQSASGRVAKVAARRGGQRLLGLGRRWRSSSSGRSVSSHRRRKNRSRARPP